MFYSKGYKYQLRKYHTVQTPFRPEQEIKLDCGFVSLSKKGVLFMDKNYAWDGGSRAIDTKAMVKASIAHDALYQLIQEGLLPLSMRNEIDDFFRDLCIQYGMTRFRAWYVHKAVSKFGKAYARPENKKEILIA